MMELLNGLGNVIITLGSLIFATAALGVLRFHDAYSRISAVGTAAGFGIAMVIGGAFLVQPSVVNLIKVLLVIALQLTTSAIGTMAIARSAYLTGSPLRRMHFDELTDPGGKHHQSPGTARF